MPKIHFITYGDNAYLNSKKRIVGEAQNSAFFDTVRAYGPEDLDPDFTKKFANILKQSRGGGFWIWKHHIIQKQLQKIDNGDYLIYLDAGCSINIHGKERFDEYIQMLTQSEHDILGFQLPHKERVWTTQQLFNHFNVDINSDVATSGQILGGILVMRKGKHLTKIFDEFLKVINHDPKLISDHYNKTGQIMEFCDNRHDQSIMSIIRKIYGSVVVPRDETYFVSFGTPESLKYPFWATRRK